MISRLTLVASLTNTVSTLNSFSSATNFMNVCTDPEHPKYEFFVATSTIPFTFKLHFNKLIKLE